MIILILYCAIFVEFLWVASAPVAHSSGIVGQFNVQASLAFVISGIIKLMRDSQWSMFKWITPATPHIAKIVSAISAFLVASGVAITHTGVFSGPEGITITIAGLSLSGLVNGFSTFVAQWMAQHLAYQAIWKPSSSDGKN